jgi:nucleotide-binding universal stress UspA family protein
MSAKPRRSYEPGHRPKFLVVIDETPECDKAVYFAARRAGRVGAALIMVAVIAPEADQQPWAGVGSLIRAEAEEEASKRLDAAAARARSIAGLEPERVIREGPKADEVLALIEQDDDIALLVLGAGSGSEGPGPLVTLLAGKGAATFPVPIAIVPGQLGEADIDALA